MEEPMLIINKNKTKKNNRYLNALVAEPRVLVRPKFHSLMDMNEKVAKAVREVGELLIARVRFAKALSDI